MGLRERSRRISLLGWLRTAGQATFRSIASYGYVDDTEPAVSHSSSTAMAYALRVRRTLTVGTTYAKQLAPPRTYSMTAGIRYALYARLRTAPLRMRYRLHIRLSRAAASAVWRVAYRAVLHRTGLSYALRVRRMGSTASSYAVYGRLQSAMVSLQYMLAERIAKSTGGHYRIYKRAAEMARTAWRLRRRLRSGTASGYAKAALVIGTQSSGTEIRYGVRRRLPVLTRSRYALRRRLRTAVTSAWAFIGQGQTITRLSYAVRRRVRLAAGISYGTANTLSAAPVRIRHGRRRRLHAPAVGITYAVRLSASTVIATRYRLFTRIAKSTGRYYRIYSRASESLRVAWRTRRRLSNTVRLGYASGLVSLTRTAIRYRLHSRLSVSTMTAYGTRRVVRMQVRSGYRQLRRLRTVAGIAYTGRVSLLSAVAMRYMLSARLRSATASAYRTRSTLTGMPTGVRYGLRRRLSADPVTAAYAVAALRSAAVRITYMVMTAVESAPVRTRYRLLQRMFRSAGQYYQTRTRWSVTGSAVWASRMRLDTATRLRYAISSFPISYTRIRYGLLRRLRSNRIRTEYITVRRASAVTAARWRLLERRQSSVTISWSDRQVDLESRIASRVSAIFRIAEDVRSVVSRWRTDIRRQQKYSRRVSAKAETVSKVSGSAALRHQ